jgi:D-galactarolactone cycloisomerase
MKITDIKTLRFRAPVPPEKQVYSRTGVRSSRSALLVEVQTDQGLTGIGSCSGNSSVIEVIIEKVLKPVLIGRDPMKLEELWDECYFLAGVKAFGSRGIGVVALSGIDIALWDIRGKIENQPLFKLLAKSPRDRVEVYATALYPEDIPKVVAKAQKFAEQGFRGVKIKLGFDFSNDMKTVQAVRAELGKGFTIMTDANMGYEINVALRAAAILEACEAAWLEEPLFLEDIQAHALLRSRFKVPIAVGENLHTRFAFQHYISQGAVDVLQPDVARVGGISEIIKIAAMAADYGLPISLHTYGDAVKLAASLHVAAALENSTTMELDCTCNPLRTELLKEPFEVNNGTMVLPSGAGLGVDLTSEALNKFLFSGEEEVKLRQKALSAA